MVKTRQGWVLMSPLELLAVEAVGGEMPVSVVGRVASAVGGVASALAVGRVTSLVGGAGNNGVSRCALDVVLASETEAVASALVSMVFAVPEVVYRAAEDVMSSVGALTVATWPMAAGTLWRRSW
eukprot:g16797.t1